MPLLCLEDRRGTREGSKGGVGGWLCQIADRESGANPLHRSQGWEKSGMTAAFDRVAQLLCVMAGRIRGSRANARAASNRTRTRRRHQM